jgi:hypothetical protein
VSISASLAQAAFELKIIVPHIIVLNMTGIRWMLFRKSMLIAPSPDQTE